MQDFLLAASRLAMTRAQSAANALADRIEELAVHATFVQASYNLSLALSPCESHDTVTQSWQLHLLHVGTALGICACLMVVSRTLQQYTA